MRFKTILLNFTRLTITLLIPAILTGCGGGGGGTSVGGSLGGGGNTIPQAVACGSNSQSTYSITWDAVNDADLTGYRIYYSKTNPVTKSNASFIDVGNVTNWSLSPSNLGLLTCDTIHIAVSSIGGTKGVSSLSTIIVTEIS